MASMRILIVDDEPLARERLRNLLGREDGVAIVAECGSGAEAIEAIREHRPDLVFLDIQMPGVDGFGVLEALGRDMPPVVFVTAFDAYAVRAFEVHALDYLLKPFKPARLREALARARERLERTGGAGADEALTQRLLALLEERRKEKETLSRIPVRTGERVVFVKVEDLDWVEASGNYIVLHAAGTRHTLRETLGAMEKRLPAERFHRVSRSALVNLERVQEIQPLFNNEHVIILTDGTKIPLTRSVRELQEKLKVL